MRRPSRPAAALFAVAALLVACGGTLEEPGADPGGEDTQEPDPSGSSDAVVGDEVQAAIREVAATEGVDPSDIQVVVSELVTWPDGSLGCPQPDEMYTQALVEGYRIVLDIGGDEITYHGQLGEDPFRCDDPADPVG